MKLLKIIASIPFFMAGCLFAWILVQAGFEVLPQATSFWEATKTLIGMAAVFAYTCLCNWAACKILELK